jgi:hypothetical protein
MSNEANTTRRTFLKTGAFVAVPAAGLGLPAVALAADDSRAALLRLQDERLLESLTRDFVRAFSRGGVDEASALFADGKAPVLPFSNLVLTDEAHDIAIADRSASARFACTVDVAQPLEGEETLVRMARLQGNAAAVQVAGKTLTASYIRHQSGWRIASIALA